VVAGLVLAQAIGRWGNYINMEAYGFRINDAMWQGWQLFPVAVEIPMQIRGTEDFVWYWHLATFFYESMWNLLVFLTLMGIRRHVKRPGDVFFWYVMLYGAGRTVIEGLRSDSLSMINQDVRITQILCALGCVAVAIAFFARRRKGPRTTPATIHDTLLLFSLALGLAVTFLSEFERNAYGMSLFSISQLLVMLLLGVNVIVGVLRGATGRPVRIVNVSFWLLAACFGLLLFFGQGYEEQYEAGNLIFIQMFPTWRQIPAMLQIAVCGGAFCFEAFELKSGKRRRPSKA